QIFASPQASQPASNLALHHLEPLQLHIRSHALQHPPVARKPSLGKPAIALHQQQSDRNEIVPQSMRQESQQIKFELSLLSHQPSAESPLCTSVPPVVQALLCDLSVLCG